MPIQDKLKEIPPITLFYIIIIAIMSIISKLYENTIFLKLIKLDYKKVILKHQYWRLITTFFYIGKLSPKLIFKFLLYFRRMKSTEKKFKKKKNLSEFIMMLFYLMIIIHICNYIGYYYFKIKINSFLSHQLMFSIILINSKREPNKTFRFYFIPIENRNVPYFLFSLRLARSGDKILNHIISFVPGLAFFWLKDVAPRAGIINDFLVNPQFLLDLLGEKNNSIYKKKKTNKKKNNINSNNNKSTEDINMNNNEKNNINEGNNQKNDLNEKNKLY